MKLWRSSLLALTLSVGLIGGANLAAADGPPSYGRVAEGPDIPSTWTSLYGGVHLGYADADFDDGLIGGLQLGKNWQAGKIVFGLEGDISFSDIDGIDLFGTVRGRLGYLFTPGLLAYGTAGVGFVEFEDEGTETDFVYGLGLESKLTERTSVRLEYLGFSDTEVDVVRAGFNFKF